LSLKPLQLESTFIPPYENKLPIPNIYFSDHPYVFNGSDDLYNYGLLKSYQQYITEDATFSRIFAPSRSLVFTSQHNSSIRDFVNIMDPTYVRTTSNVRDTGELTIDDRS
ncbi:29066_t:CDS:2, partial [Racocetra persica]